jgi:hypothetical protein
LRAINQMDGYLRTATDTRQITFCNLFQEPEGEMMGYIRHQVSIEAAFRRSSALSLSG